MVVFVVAWVVGVVVELVIVVEGAASVLAGKVTGSDVEISMCGVVDAAMEVDVDAGWVTVGLPVVTVAVFSLETEVSLLLITVVSVTVTSPSVNELPCASETASKICQMCTLTLLFGFLVEIFTADPND